jgi:hypothetical protein
MAILINDNYSLAATKPFDARYLNISTPWTSIAAVNAAITTYRYTGLTVNINGVEYWYANGVGDGNLIIKDSGIANTGITTAINGLTKIGNRVVLGGALTGNTIITLKSDTCSLTFTDTAGTTRGIVYGGDYSAGFGANSLISAKYVTGCTCILRNDITWISGNTVSVIAMNLYSGTTAPTQFANKGAVNNYTGVTNGRLDTIEGIYLTGATNGLGLSGKKVCLGGALLNDTTITGAYTFGLNTTNINFTGNSAINLGGTIKLMSTPTGGTASNAILVWDSVDKQIKQITTTSFGDKNNIYSKTIITGNTTGTTASTYVILINHSGITLTFTLPNLPLDGQAFKIKDVSGNALQFNIIIDGNGKNIDGSSTALINTDYGAFNLIYDSILNEWFRLAFVN